MTPFRPRMLTGPEVQVANSRQAFDADGRLIDARYVKALSTLMEDLHREVRRSTETLSRTA
jgi:chromate reductase, NAD(P)H dehydrogenase (quinone)